MGKILRMALLFIFLLMCSGVMAQNQGTVIKGTVTDDKGVTLPGVTVTVKGSKTNAVTDLNGNYGIQVSPDARTLVFSFIGMETQEITIGTKTVINVTLKLSSTELTDVVVIGYGAIRKADVTSSISSVSEKDIKNLPVAGIDAALQGKVSGVTISNNGGQPGGGVSVQIRGITSVNNNAPLYVIDGVPIPAEVTSMNQNVLGGGSGSTTQSFLATLDPADIESVDILKDASAQAIYGSRGAYGVVLITTKHGKSGTSKISYDTYYGEQEIPKKLDVMDLQQYATYVNSLVLEARAVPGSGGTDSIGEFQNPSVLGHGTDWQDAIYQKGHIMSHQLGISGGANKTTYYFSGGYFNQTGTLINTGFDRYSLRANIDQQVNSWLKAGFSTNLTQSDQKIGLADGFDAVTSDITYNSPAVPIRDAYGNFVTNTIIGGSQFAQQSNPVALASERKVTSDNTTGVGQIYATINFFKGLSLRNEFDYDFNYRKDQAFQPLLVNSVTGQNILTPSTLSLQNTNSLYWGLKNYLDYNATFGKSRISATAGHEAQKSVYEYLQVSRVNLPLNLVTIGSTSSGDGSNTKTNAGGPQAWSQESYFARGTYTYNDRYAISGTVRGDGSSNFGPNKKWGIFPAGSASWTATNEEFLKGIKDLNYLKFRIGFGEVGGQNVSSGNQYTANINLNSYSGAPFGPGGLPANLPNPNFSWEAVKTYNAGVDATLFNNVAEVTVDVYKKITTDMLLPTQLPSYSGISSDPNTYYNSIASPIINDGQMTNTGVDLSITTYNIRNKDFNWKTTFIFSHYNNVLNRLNTGDPSAEITGGITFYDGSSKIIAVTKPGGPVGAFYGYKTDGLFTSQAELAAGPIPTGLSIAPNSLWLGDIRYQDINHDGKIDGNDITMIGNPNPKFTYGFTNAVSWKGIDLSIFIYGSYGGQIYNYTRMETEAESSPYNNQLATVLNRYTATNPGGTLPRFNEWSNNNIAISDRFVESGSYLRIQNLSLGYNFPKDMLRSVKMSNARIFASVQNLYTFTKYSGYDPELGTLNSQATFMNVDVGHYPNPRTFSIGANVEF